MRNPPSPPASRRTCPACGRPAEPGNKFCANCGTWIPVMLTCSKCGTQFIHPYEHCDLCGAPLIPEETPEPEESEDTSGEEGGGQTEDQGPATDDEEIPETDTVVEEQETIVPARGGQHHAAKEIPEPDTDELLEQFGKEYAEDETLASSHSSKPPSPSERRTQKPIPSPLDQGSAETVDDALFLSLKRPEPAPQRRGRFTWIIAGCIVLAVVAAAVYFIGLPMLRGVGYGGNGNPPAITTTFPGTLTTVTSVTPPTSSRLLVPLPTQTLPSGQKLMFQVSKDPLTAKITVTFLGSASQDGFTSADIRVTRPDGSISSGLIQPLKGQPESVLAGSNKTDRVEILAHLSDDRTYRVYDALVPFSGI